MKTAVGPAFYDALLDNPDSAYLHKTGGPYEDLYRHAAALVPAMFDVCDLGCGTGRFARILHDQGHEGVYTGVDFAPALLAEARRHCPEGLYELADITDWNVLPADLYVALELLEHLDDDLGLLERLPHDALIVLSVPSFDSESHVRTFPNPRDARARYDHHILIEQEQLVYLPSGAFFHLLSGSLR